MVEFAGKTWTDVFGRYNSGTYNNQWMIVDYKRFKPGQPLKDDLLWVLEQLPSLVEAGDMTDRLRSQTYWPSYNCPAFPNVFNLSGQVRVRSPSYQKEKNETNDSFYVARFYGSLFKQIQ